MQLHSVLMLLVVPHLFLGMDAAIAHEASIGGRVGSVEHALPEATAHARQRSALRLWATHTLTIADTQTLTAFQFSDAHTAVFTGEMRKKLVSSFEGPPLGPGGNHVPTLITPAVPSEAGSFLQATIQGTRVEIGTTGSTVTNNSASTPISIAQNPKTVPSLTQTTPPREPCWASFACKSVLGDFSDCYKIGGNLTEPNGRDGDGLSLQSQTFQACLCDGHKYKELANSQCHLKILLTRKQSFLTVF
jgi:hypothetical protein